MMEWLSQRTEAERRRVLWALMGVSAVFVLGLWGFTRWDESRRPESGESAALQDLFGGVGEAARGVQGIRDAGVEEVLNSGEGVEVESDVEISVEEGGDSEVVEEEQDLSIVEVEDEGVESVTTDSLPRLPLE